MEQDVSVVAPLNNDKQSGKKGLKIAFVIVSVLLVFGIGYGVFSFMQNNEKDGEIKDLKSKVTALQNLKEENTENDDETPIIDDSSLVDRFGFSSEKIVNKKENVSYEVVSGKLDYTFYVSIGNFVEQSKEVTLLIDWHTIASAHREAPNNFPEDKVITLTQPAIDVHAACLVQMPESEVLLFLMQDGSISYMKVTDIISNNFTVYENLGGIKGAVKFYDGMVRSDITGNGGFDTFIQTETGDIYSLNALLGKE